MSKSLYIPVLVGTIRDQRKSIYVANLVKKVGDQIDGVEVDVIDPKDYNFPGDGNGSEAKDPKYTKVTEQADGFFIVSPEYNHSFPGSLKRMLDSELSNYIHKPVAFAGVSAGQWGGIRAIEALVQTVREMGLVSIFVDMQFPKVQDLFNDQREIKDKSYEEYTLGAWTELIWMAKVLKHGRENVESKYHK